MRVVFVEPAFPNNQRQFVRGLAEAGAEVIGLGERPQDWLDDELRGATSAYRARRATTEETAFGSTVPGVTEGLRSCTTLGRSSCAVYA